MCVCVCVFVYACVSYWLFSLKVLYCLQAESVKVKSFSRSHTHTKCDNANQQNAIFQTESCFFRLFVVFLSLAATISSIVELAWIQVWCWCCCCCRFQSFDLFLVFAYSSGLFVLNCVLLFHLLSLPLSISDVVKNNFLYNWWQNVFSILQSLCGLMCCLVLFFFLLLLGFWYLNFAIIFCWSVSRMNHALYTQIKSLKCVRFVAALKFDSRGCIFA